MAKAIFTENFDWSDPKSRYGFSAVKSPDPQNFPSAFIDAAVAAGRARRVPLKGKADKPAKRSEQKDAEEPGESLEDPQPPTETSEKSGG